MFEPFDTINNLIHIPQMTSIISRFIRAMLVLWLVGGGVAPLWSATPEDEVVVNGRRAFPNRVLARLRPQNSRESAALSLGPQSGVRILRASKLVPGLLEIDVDPGQGGARPLAVTHRSGAELSTRIAALHATGQFAYVEPDYISTLQGQPTDKWQALDLWGLKNPGTNGQTGVDIDAARAWNFVNGKPEVIVAVFDTGIRTTHRELAPNLWVNPGEIPGNGLDDDGDGFVDDVNGVNLINSSSPLLDDNGHGTHVAGTIAASGTDGGGLVGVAWGCRIMGIKAADAAGRFTSSTIIQGLEYATRHGARVVNASFGGTSFSQAEYDAFAAANTAGVTVICAAGNDGQNNDILPHFPASYRLPNVISVEAVDRYGRLPDFSDFGATSVDVAAPGVGIVSCAFKTDNTLRVLSGTSMAAPHVTGVAALLLSAYPRITVSELRQRLIHSSVPLASLTSKVASGGVVSAFRALLLTPDGNAIFDLRPLKSASLVAGQANTLEITATVSRSCP